MLFVVPAWESRRPITTDTLNRLFSSICTSFALWNLFNGWIREWLPARAHEDWKQGQGRPWFFQVHVGSWCPLRHSFPFLVFLPPSVLVTHGRVLAALTSPRLRSCLYLINGSPVVVPRPAAASENLLEMDPWLPHGL